MRRVFYLIIFLIYLSGCQNSPTRRIASTNEFLGCYQTATELVADSINTVAMRFDQKVLNKEPVVFDKYIAYLKDDFLFTGPQFVVRRLEDGKVIHSEVIDDAIPGKIDGLAFDTKKGVVYGVKDGKRIKRFGGFRIKVVKRTPVSYNEVLQAMKKEPYEMGRLPDIPLQMFRFMRNRMFDFFVGRRSTEILVQGADYRQQSMVKPIHPMGIGVEGRISFRETKYSGLLNGGSFPLLGRLSISQGNPSKYKQRSWIRRLFDLPAAEQPRSVALAIKVFPTDQGDNQVVTGNAVFQNDLNGEFLENYIDGVMTNQPALDIRKIRESYELFTLLGVAKGALSNPNDVKKGSPFINPQIRPIHQLAEMGVDNPAEVRTPTWIKIQAEEGTEITPRDDFREELEETIKNRPLRYTIFLGDEVNDEGEIIWEEAGEMVFENTILARGVDENVLFYHSGLRSDYTGEIVEPIAVPIPERSPVN